ncbi:MAG: homocysteine S-methyltransferase [bacterium]
MNGLNMTIGKNPQPLAPFFEKQGVVILDGGLATELERRGHDLDHPLWSARVGLLLKRPEAIRRVHLAYLEAGADCIISASYQASLPGFQADGLPVKQARSLIKKTVALACEAREVFLENIQRESKARLRPLVAASIGPYGAYLADGSEYLGNYGVSSEALRTFHLPRWQALAETEADLFACETIPSYQEAGVLLELMQETPEILAWISFSCRDGVHISDGTPIQECAALFGDISQVVAIGVNCTAPRFIASLIRQVRNGAPDKPVVVYPNSGETYDAARRVWTGISDPIDFAQAARDWRAKGASLVGGCCRTGPEHIRAIRQAVLG